MPGQIPDVPKVFRILHITNLEYMLVNGIYTKNDVNADPNYINIGDTGLISKRQDYVVKINPPNGELGEYIPFYFGPLSPMLLKIRDGDGGVTKRPQSEIIYVVCRIETIKEFCPEWCFTNGHSVPLITEFYNSTEHLDKVDWDVVSLKYWRNTEDDLDRMRRKQAEFLVKNHIPSKCIGAIVTYNNDTKEIVLNILKKLELDIPVRVNPKNNFYY